MSFFFPIPRRVRIRFNEIKKIKKKNVGGGVQRGEDFLWGSHLEGRKMHLMSWRIVCKHKKYVGLGIRR